MNIYIKTLLIFSLMIMSTMAFAFPADPDVTADPPAPIDNYIYFVFVIAIGFAFWMYSKKSIQP